MNGDGRDPRQLSFKEFLDDPSPIVADPRVTRRMVAMPVKQISVSGVVGVGPFMRDSARVSTEVQLAAGRLWVRLEADVLTDHLPPVQVTESESVTFQRPASWWQHFKAQYGSARWLSWLVRRRPVQYEDEQKTLTVVVDLQRFRVFPQAEFRYPNEFGCAVLWSDVATRSRLR